MSYGLTIAPVVFCALLGSGCAGGAGTEDVELGSQAQKVTSCSGIVLENADGRRECIWIGVRPDGAPGTPGELFHEWQVAPGSEVVGVGLLDGSGTRTNGGRRGAASYMTGARNSDGRLEIFYVSNGCLYHNYQQEPNGAWSGEIEISCNVYGSDRNPELTVGMHADGRLEIFWLGRDGKIRHAWQHNWESELLGDYATDILEAGVIEGKFRLRYVGNDGLIYERIYDGTCWSEPRPMRNKVGCGPHGIEVVAVRNPDGHLECFWIGRGPDGGPSGNGKPAIYHEWVNADGSLSGFQRLSPVRPRPLFQADALGNGSHLAVGANADGRLEVFYSYYGILYHNAQLGGDAGWMGEMVIDTPCRLRKDADITVANHADGRLEVFYIAANGDLCHSYQEEKNGGTWHSAKLGGQAKEILQAGVINGKFRVIYIGLNNVKYERVLENGAWGEERVLQTEIDACKEVAKKCAGLTNASMAKKLMELFETVEFDSSRPQKPLPKATADRLIELLARRNLPVEMQRFLRMYVNELFDESGTEQTANNVIGHNLVAIQQGWTGWATRMMNALANQRGGTISDLMMLHAMQRWPDQLGVTAEEAARAAQLFASKTSPCLEANNAAAGYVRAKISWEMLGMSDSGPMSLLARSYFEDAGVVGNILFASPINAIDSVITMWEGKDGAGVTTPRYQAAAKFAFHMAMTGMDLAGASAAIGVTAKVSIAAAKKVAQSKLAKQFVTREDLVEVKRALEQAKTAAGVGDDVACRPPTAVASAAETCQAECKLCKLSPELEKDIEKAIAESINGPAPVGTRELADLRLQWIKVWLQTNKEAGKLSPKVHDLLVKWMNNMADEAKVKAALKSVAVDFKAFVEANQAKHKTFSEFWEAYATQWAEKNGYRPVSFSRNSTGIEEDFLKKMMGDGKSPPFLVKDGVFPEGCSYGQHGWYSHGLQQMLMHHMDAETAKGLMTAFARGETFAQPIPLLGFSYHQPSLKAASVENPLLGATQIEGGTHQIQSAWGIVMDGMNPVARGFLVADKTQSLICLFESIVKAVVK